MTETLLQSQSAFRLVRYCVNLPVPKSGLFLVFLCLLGSAFGYRVRALQLLLLVSLDQNLTPKFLFFRTVVTPVKLPLALNYPLILLFPWLPMVYLRCLLIWLFFPNDPIFQKNTSLQGVHVRNRFIRLLLLPRRVTLIRVSSLFLGRRVARHLLARFCVCQIQVLGNGLMIGIISSGRPSLMATVKNLSSLWTLLGWRILMSMLSHGF